MVAEITYKATYRDDSARTWRRVDGEDWDIGTELQGEGARVRAPDMLPVRGVMRQGKGWTRLGSRAIAP